MNNPDTLDEILATFGLLIRVIPGENKTAVNPIFERTKKQLLQWRATTLLEMIGEDDQITDEADGGARVITQIRNELQHELRQQIEQQTKEVGK